MSDSYDAWMHEMLRDYSAEIEQLKAELEQVKKERDKLQTLLNARVEAAEGALRSLASYVGNGGYNAPVVDAKEFRLKVVEGIDTLVSVEASRREALSLKYETACGTIRTMQAEREGLMQRIHAQASERDEARVEMERVRKELRERDTEDVEMVADANKLLETIATLTRERDEARRLHSVLHDVASGGCLHTLLKHEHACAVGSINRHRRELSEAWALIAEIEQEDHWILEGQCTMQSCEANGKAIVAEARRRLARNAEMDSLEYTRK